MVDVVHKAGRLAGHTVDMPFDIARTLVRSGLAEWPADGGVIEAKATKPAAVERTAEPSVVVASAGDEPQQMPRRRGRPPKTLTV